MDVVEQIGFDPTSLTLGEVEDIEDAIGESFGVFTACILLP